MTRSFTCSLLTLAGLAAGAQAQTGALFVGQEGGDIVHMAGHRPADNVIAGPAQGGERRHQIGVVEERKNPFHVIRRSGSALGRS